MLALAGHLRAQTGPAESPADTSKAPCHTAAITGQHVSCYGLSDGSATVTINVPGTYKIIWSDGTVVPSTTALTHTIPNRPAGYYDVQVINISNGCSAFDIFNITQPNLLTAGHTSTDVKCFGLSTAGINLTVAGGTTLYSFLWSNGATSEDLSNIPEGTYSVIVTDNKNCKAYDTVVISQPAQAVGDSLVWKNPACNGFTNGWIDVTVWGGVAPYVYNWSNGAPTQDLNNIGAGAYAVTITDANNCEVTAGASLTQPAALQLTTQFQNNLCYGFTNGTVNLTVNGGTLPYSFAWASSDYMLSWPDEDLSDLASDTYFVTVTDAQGCFRLDSALITEPTQITSAITSTNVTSFGGSNGSINLQIAGGMPQYIIAWSNGSSTQNLTGIPKGWYFVTITDQNGCVKRDSVYISEPLSPLTAALTVRNATCPGGSDGTVLAEPAGGTPPYSLLWSTGSAEPEISGLAAGVYSITVTDFFGNTFVTSDSVLQPATIAFTYSVTNVSCFGLPDGAIDLSVSGGTPSYTYRWLNSHYVLAALTADISGMPADVYYLEVTDTAGCKNAISISITQPPVLAISLEHVDASCAGSASGSASCSANGGTAPYDYAWSNGESTASIEFLHAGSYAVTVNDEHGCFISDSVMILQPDSVRMDFSIVPVSCIDQHDGQATVYAHGGNGDYSYLWSTNHSDASITDLYAGLYQVTVSDFMGCTGNGSVEVTRFEIPCINIPTCFTPNGDGLNDVWVIKDANLYPGFFMEIYNRWGQLVYNLNGTWESWDGTYKDKPMPAETYYYFIRLRDESETMQGTVTIIR